MDKYFRSLPPGLRRSGSTRTHRLKTPVQPHRARRCGCRDLHSFSLLFPRRTFSFSDSLHPKRHYFHGTASVHQHLRCSSRGVPAVSFLRNSRFSSRSAARWKPSSRCPSHAARRSLLSDPGSIPRQNGNHRILASDSSRSQKHPAECRVFCTRAPRSEPAPGCSSAACTARSQGRTPASSELYQWHLQSALQFLPGYRLRLPSSRAALWCVPAIPLCSFRNEPHRPLHCATGSRSQGSIHKTECSPANYGAPVPGCIPSGSFAPADTVPYRKSSHPGWNRRILSADKRRPLMHGNRVRAGRALRRSQSRRAAPRPSDSKT